MNLSDTQPIPALLDQLVAPPTEQSVKQRFDWLQFFPPRAIEWNRVELPIKRLPRALHGLRVLHLSDVHLRRRWPAALNPLFDRIRQDPPDLLFFTGDFVDNKWNHRPAMPQVRRFIEQFTARIGCFAIHGNHDSYKIGEALRDSHVKFLDGCRQVIEARGEKIEIIGFPGKHRKELTADFIKSLPEPAAHVPRIILSHFPDHLKKTGGLGADLFLSGHTHGGQVCMPDGGALLWHDGLPRKLAKGAHRIGDTWLVVSRGIGWTGLPIRAFSLPEVVEMKLVVDC
jgi:predicted MPP superfamily phosphohydrolase